MEQIPAAEMERVLRVQEILGTDSELTLFPGGQSDRIRCLSPK
mgnify:CR=1 FL=1